MTIRESSHYRLRVGLAAAFFAVGCGSPPAAAGPASTPNDVTVPKPEIAEAPPSGVESDTPPASPRPPAETVTPALATSLEDGYAEHLPQRVKVPSDATARANLNDPAPSQSPSTDHLETLVVAKPPNDDKSPVRAVVDNKALRVLVWLDPSQIVPVITERADLSRTAKATRRRTVGVTVYPGMIVSRGAERAGRVEVEGKFEFPSPDSALVTAKGWVESSKVGHVYLPAQPKQQSFPRGNPSHIKEATAVLAAPGGAVLAKVGEGGGGIFFPVTILGTRGPMREIYFAGGEIEVRGFVPESVLEQLEPEGERGWGRGFGKASLWQRWPKEQVRIPVGTCIYDSAGGEAIGVFKREHLENVVIPSEGSPYRAYRLPYDAVGYVYASDLSPVKKGEEQATSKESMTLSPGSWVCPKRTN